MARVIKIIGALAAVIVLAVVALHVYQVRRARKAGILSESIQHQGDLWNVNFTARLPAPEKAVFGAIEHIEDMHSDDVTAVKVVSQEGNRKTVDLQMAGPAGQSITTRIAFEYFPQSGRISYRTVDNPLMDSRADYELADEGQNTLISFHQTSRILVRMNLPDAIIRQAARSLFIAQLEGIRRALNLTAADEAEEESDEP